jgi:hypothetical protein
MVSQIPCEQSELRLLEPIFRAELLRCKIGVEVLRCERLLGTDMSTTMTVAVTIAPDVLAFVDRLGQRRELELMIDRAKHFVPGLTAIDVALDPATDDMPPGVVLWTHRDDTGPDNDPTQRSWIDWMATNFSPEVCENFVLLPVYHTNGQ